MQSNKFVEAGKRIIRENPEIFEALVDFEKTGRLPRITHRQRINMTIDSFLLARFRKYCSERSLNMSRLIEKHIKEELGLRSKTG